VGNVIVDIRRFRIKQDLTCEDNFIKEWALKVHPAMILEGGSE
jgi:hypothetical protein